MKAKKLLERQKIDMIAGFPVDMEFPPGSKWEIKIAGAVFDLDKPEDMRLAESQLPKKPFGAVAGGRRKLERY